MRPLLPSSPSSLFSTSDDVVRYALSHFCSSNKLLEDPDVRATTVAKRDTVPTSALLAVLEEDPPATVSAWEICDGWCGVLTSVSFPSIQTAAKL